jgi:hypothetical protein
MFTRPGGVHLVNESVELLERDYAAIHDLRHGKMFKFKRELKRDDDSILRPPSSTDANGNGSAPHQ